jgi:hypothetical protein
MPVNLKQLKENITILNILLRDASEDSIGNLVWNNESNQKLVELFKLLLNEYPLMLVGEYLSRLGRTFADLTEDEIMKLSKGNFIIYGDMMIIARMQSEANKPKPEIF